MGGINPVVVPKMCGDSPMHKKCPGGVSVTCIACEDERAGAILWNPYLLVWDVEVCPAFYTTMGASLGYTGYIELAITLIVVGSLRMCGVVQFTKTGKSIFEDWEQAARLSAAETGSGALS